MRGRNGPVWVLGFLIGGGAGAVLTKGCCCDLCPEYPTVAFQCDATQGSDACPTDFVCCSDDPTTLGGGLPAFQGLGIEGEEPLFAGVNNRWSDSGMCVRAADILPGQGLFEPPTCPIPCNPTWAPDQVEVVCGAGRHCCQTQELEESDCVMDPELGCWRAARGSDVGTNATPWKDHETAQDPDLRRCLALGDIAGQDVVDECVDRLTVADQRGYCLQLPPKEQCETEDVDYVDPCELLNMLDGLEC